MGFIMRNVILHALQTGDLGIDPRFDSLSENFVDDPALILKDHVMPRLDMQIEMLKKCNTGNIAASTLGLAQKPASLAMTTEDITGMGWFLLTDASLFNELVVQSYQIAEERISKLAKDQDMHIAACYVKRTDGKNYNVTSIFGPDGQICGEYRKSHIPPNEMWQIADGEYLNAIELDFGVVGTLICYDIMFPEAASVLAMSGAEIILHPTAGYGWYDSIGEATLRTRANDNSVYILTAKNFVYNSEGKSSLIDPWGQVLVDAGFYKNVIVSKEIDLDVPKTQPQWFYQSQMSGYDEVKKRIPHERRPDLYAALTEPATRLRIPDEDERVVLRDRVRDGKCRWN